MRANHSPLQFFGLIATASVLASGVYANAAHAGTTPSTTESNGASASPVLVGSSSASETGTRSLVDGTRAAVDSNRTSRAMRSVTTTTTTATNWRVVESRKWPSGERLGDAWPAARAGHHPRGAGQRPGRQRPPARLPALTSGSPRSSAAGTRRARPPAPPSDRRRPRRPPRRIPHLPTPLQGPRWRLSSQRGSLLRRSRLRRSPRRRRRPRRPPRRISHRPTPRQGPRWRLSSLRSSLPRRSLLR